MKQVMYFVHSIEGEMLNDFEDEENARKFAQVWQERGKIVFVTRMTTEFVALDGGPRP
jgi:hypothetical protein